VEFICPAQNQAEFNHVRGIRHAVVGAVFHGTEKQGAIVFVAKNNDRRMKGHVAYLIHESKASIEIALRARGSEVKQYHIAPFPQVVEPLKLELIDPTCGEAVA
jgi:hypothetical protein